MAVFDKIAWLYDPLVRLSSRSRRCAEKIKFVAKLKKSDVVLDIGGGTGLIASFISDDVKKIIVLDPSKKMMAKSKSDKIEKVYGTVQEMKFKDSTFDVVYCVDTFHHFTNGYKKNPDDVCAIVLTSGTTGIPKAVQLTYGNFETSCANWHNFLKFKDDDQFLCCLPLHHIGGLAVLIRALIYGFSVNLVNEFQAEIVLKNIQNHPVTIISLVPTMLKRILDIDGGLEALKTLRHILLGGGPSPEYLLDICIKEKLNIVKVYGMSETCSGTIGLKLLDEPQHKFYAGRPFPNTKVWIENDEIHISGPMVMKGYVGETETNGTFNSHDLGRIDDDNLLFLDIRRKDLIVTGGENVNPIEVEECLMNIEGISDAAVVGIDDDEWGQKVTAYIVTASLENEFLHSELKKFLSPYKIPKEYLQVSHIPRNELGKIVYEKLRSL